MTICGVKLTHDGSVAVIQDNKLITCIEHEKLDNNERYSSFDFKSKQIAETITEQCPPSNIDCLVIDGWNDKVGSGRLPLLHGYDPLTTGKPVLDALTLFPIDRPPYHSYQHVSSHVLSAYCTSEFSKVPLSSFILVWDGAIGPQLYYFDATSRQFEIIGWLHYLYGDIYGEFAHHFPPFAEGKLHDLSLAGKVMAYVAKGMVVHDLLEKFREIYDDEEIGMTNTMPTLEECRQFSKRVIASFLALGKGSLTPPNDMITTFHEFLGNLIIDRLAKKVALHPSRSRLLCFAGGCALNIKWNHKIRSSGIFKKVWIPPFPNDAGSAIGTACCEMVRATGNYQLEWNIFSGPALLPLTKPEDGWQRRACTLEQLAWVIHLTNEPVVFLDGRAELGPRALGHRSILAAPISNEIKERLNEIKEREEYRPIAPVCLEEDAPDIFIPGTPDPFMLYEHLVRKDWQDKVPAVTHLDGTARLQTVTQASLPNIYELISFYKAMSGIPLLCNTSANLKGRGFFPDVRSAMLWGRCNYIWSGGFIFLKEHSAPEIHSIIAQ